MTPEKGTQNQAETRIALIEKTFHADSEMSVKPDRHKLRSQTSHSIESVENSDNNLSLNADAETITVSGKRCIKAVARNVAVEQNKKKSPSNIANNNDNNKNIENIKEPLLLARLCDVEQTKMVTPNADYTEDDLKSFLMDSSIESFDFSAHSTEQLFRRFIDATFKMKEVTLAKLIDQYHLGIIMQAYKPLETLCSSYRFELMDAVSQLSIDMPSDMIEFIGTCLCDRYVIGNGMYRMERVVKMQHALSNLIIMGDLNRQIAMSVLLATFVKISGKQPNHTITDIISRTFEMIKLIDWMQMSVTGNVADMFILLRCFSLILNTPGNRNAHSDWDAGLGQEIYNHFMRVLSTVRLSPNYDYFEMMVERYLAFGIIRNAKKRFNLSRILQ